MNVRQEISPWADTKTAQKSFLAFEELIGAIKYWRLWTLLGWLDIRQRYARSRLGPFWITISMGTLIVSIALVYGTLFGQPLRDYLPFIGFGFVLWAWISGTINDGCYAYINNAHYILQSDIPLWIYVFQTLWRQTIIFFHNTIIIVALILIYQTTRLQVLPLFLAGSLLVLLNLLWIVQLTALISARYRDIPQIVAAVMQVFFYLTPLMWRPEMLPGHQWIIALNPFASLIDLLRAPLLGTAPLISSWYISGAMALLGCPATLWLSKKTSWRIAYWV